MGLQFLDFSMILSSIYKVLLKPLKSEETSCTQPLPDLKVHRCALGLPHRTPTAVGALAGGEVGPGDAKKRVGSSIGLTRGRLATETRPGNGPVMAGGEATAALRGGEVPGECEGGAKP
jgi:hypothetical protein